MTMFFRKMIVSVVAVAAIVVGAFSTGVEARGTDHCPDHNGHPGKVEGAYNTTVLDAGTVFCVKGSTVATGVVTSDGVTDLKTYLGIGKDVSYYVVYERPQPPTTTQPPVITEPTVTEPTVTEPTVTEPPATLPEAPSIPSEPSNPAPGAPGPETPSLPVTGPSATVWLTVIALTLLGAGGLFTLLARRD